MDWVEAHARANEQLAGAERIRLPGASSPEFGEIELAGLDWGGEGELVVMHHANGFCAASLGEVAARLSSQGYRVISVDARGHGDSTSVVPGGEPSPYDWGVLSLDIECAIAAILERTGRERVELAIGHSFGGALMLAAASRQPARFARLLLCDPVIFPPMSEAEKASAARGNVLVEATLRRRDHFPSYAEAFAHCGSRGLFANFTPVSLALYIGEGMRPTEDEQVTLKCAREVEAAIFGGGGSLDLTGRVSEVSADVRILHALKGNFSRPVYDRLAAEMSSAGVESLDAGHLFLMEQPDLVLAHVADMMGQA
jgi:pimeloyl-ACP methyl ester carboxylesterase